LAPRDDVTQINLVLHGFDLIAVMIAPDRDTLLARSSSRSRSARTAWCADTLQLQHGQARIRVDLDGIAVLHTTASSAPWDFRRGAATIRGMVALGPISN